MTSTRERTDPDTASGVLAGLRDAEDRVRAAESDKLQLAVAWAAMHSADSLNGPLSSWEGELSIAGEGAPTVAEFCVPELAAALGLSTDAGRGFLGEAVELRHRLPRVYARVVAGDLAAWRARRVAHRTVTLPPAAASFVDAHVSPVAHKIGPVQLDRLIAEAIARHDPDETQRLRDQADRGRRFDVHHRTRELDGAGGLTGVVEVTGTLDAADALDLEAAIQHIAAQLAAAGCEESLDVRRAMALGHLARRDDLLPDGEPTDDTARPAKARRRLVLHVHLADADLARCEETRAMLTVTQVQDWCTHPDTTVVIQPVIDLNSNPHTDAYEVPDRIREHVILRDHTCVFPWCTRPARGPTTQADLDHREPWPVGPTEPANLAPLCRRHHRAKTHAGWTYQSPGPGVYQWRSPHGYHYRRDPSGTTDTS